MLAQPFKFYLGYSSPDQLIIPSSYQELEKDVFKDNIIEELEIKNIASLLHIREEEDLEELTKGTKMVVTRTLNIPQYLDITDKKCIE